jgi:hypothetical protein
MRRAPLGALLALAVLGSTAPGAAEEESARPRIFKWVDENGIAHYTTDRDRIPSNLRGRVRSAEDARREAQSERAAQTDAPAEALPAAPAPADPATGTGAPVNDTGFGAAAPAAPAAAAPAAPDTTRGSGGTRSEAWSTRDAGPDAPPGPDVRGTGTPQPDPEREARARELEVQIASLEVEMAKDEERLKQLISEARAPVEGQPAPLYGVPELEELAKRFPKLQADLSALRAERRRLTEE